MSLQTELAFRLPKGFVDDDGTLHRDGIMRLARASAEPRLTDECLAFARAKGYKRMQLWTNSCLTAARKIYAARGFVLTRSEDYQGFGQSMTGETWELKL